MAKPSENHFFCTWLAYFQFIYYLFVRRSRTKRGIISENDQRVDDIIFILFNMYTTKEGAKWQAQSNGVFVFVRFKEWPKIMLGSYLAVTTASKEV
jgi:hypothetical protein